MTKLQFKSLTHNTTFNKDNWLITQLQYKSLTHDTISVQTTDSSLIPNWVHLLLFRFSNLICLYQRRVFKAFIPLFNMYDVMHCWQTITVWPMKLHHCQPVQCRRTKVENEATQASPSKGQLWRHPWCDDALTSWSLARSTSRCPAGEEEHRVKRQSCTFIMLLDTLDKVFSGHCDTSTGLGGKTHAVKMTIN